MHAKRDCWVWRGGVTGNDPAIKGCKGPEILVTKIGSRGFSGEKRRGLNERYSNGFLREHNVLSTCADKAISTTITKFGYFQVELNEHCSLWATLFCFQNACFRFQNFSQHDNRSNAHRVFGSFQFQVAKFCLHFVPPTEFIYHFGTLNLMTSKWVEPSESVLIASIFMNLFKGHHFSIASDISIP